MKSGIGSAWRRWCRRGWVCRSCRPAWRAAAWPARASSPSTTRRARSARRSGGARSIRRCCARRWSWCGGSMPPAAPAKPRTGLSCDVLAACRAARQSRLPFIHDAEERSTLLARAAGVPPRRNAIDRTDWRMTTSAGATLAITLTVQALVSAAAMVVPVLAPALSADTGASAGLVGVYVALVYVGAMGGSLLAGGWVARQGAIRASQWGLALCAVGLLCSMSGLIALLALGAVLLGLGYGPITPASSHLLVQTTPAHRMSFVFSVKQTGVPLGGVLAGLVAPKLDIAIGWRGALLVTALACLACAALAQRVRAGLDADRNPRRHVRLGDLRAP